jgi:PIN domain nuclease of toxin-antitoxin system
MVCAGYPKLSDAARTLIEDSESHPFLSIASLWEIAIKISLGKLQLTQPYEEFISQQLAMNGIGILNVTIDHTAAVSALPFHHRDPFDRLLAVQSKIKEMVFVSADPAFDAYEVNRVW